MRDDRHVRRADSCEHSGTATNIVADPDNTLYESVTGDLSNGTGPNVFVGNTLGSDKRRARLHFDIAGNVPAGSTVTATTLTLHVSNSNSGAQTIALHTLTSDWGEGTYREKLGKDYRAYH